MWIFGYGSLVWKIDFKYEQMLIGCIRGYLRRFYQHSIDHRGSSDKPGRVVTLIPSNDPYSKVWGVAYKIYDEDTAEVIKNLDYRERNGYTKKNVTFYPKDGSLPFQLTIYIATSDNNSYAGPASIESIAQQIVESKGWSGSNKEYLYKLADGMRRLAPDIEDEHLYSLETAVKKIDPDIKKINPDIKKQNNL